MTMSGGNRYTQHALDRHSMAAITPIVEKATSTVPLAVVVRGGMDIVLALELDLEARELDALRLFCIAFRFCDLTDHA